MTPAFSFSHNKNFSQGDLKENQVALFLSPMKGESPCPDVYKRQALTSESAAYVLGVSEVRALSLQ